MIFRDINIINTCHVLHPEKSIPPDLCPADEIAAPDKLMKVMSAPLRAWKRHTYDNHEFFYLKVKWRRTFHNCVRSEYFYVICDDPLIFSRDVHDYRAVFVVTCPVFSYVKGLRSYYYTVANEFTTNVDVVYPHDNHLNLLLNSSAYTICNGLILELAKMRSGGTNMATVEHIKDYFAMYPAYQPVPDHFMDLYISHRYPQIAEHPYLYYYTPDCPLTEFLNETYNPYDQHTNQYTDAMNRVCYRTSQKIIRFSVQPRFNESDYPVDKHMIDIVSLLRGIAQRRAVYKWYLRNRYEIFAKYLQFNKQTKISQFLLKRVCAIYNETPCRRLFKVFKDVLMFMGPRPTWIHRSIIVKLIRNPEEWHPKIPMGFIKHCAEIMFTEVTFRVFTMDEQVKERFEEVFENCMVDESRIKIRLWDLVPEIRPYYEARISSRLCALTAATRDHGSALWEPIQCWLESNKNALIL